MCCHLLKIMYRYKGGIKMKDTLNLMLFVSVILIFSFITGCTNTVGTSADTPKEEDTHYKTGASVSSLPYKDIQSIDLYLKDANTGKFHKISNGGGFRCT